MNPLSAGRGSTSCTRPRCTWRSSRQTQTIDRDAELSCEPASRTSDRTPGAHKKAGVCSAHHTSQSTSPSVPAQQDFDEKKLQQQRQTLEIVEVFACEAKNLRNLRRFLIVKFSSFFFQLFSFFIFCIFHFVHFSFSSFFSFFSPPSRRQNQQKIVEQFIL